MTLTTGVTSVATSSIYKLNAKALHNERVIVEWLKASQPTWREVPNKSFWVFISLPTLIFFLSVGLFISTVMLTVWERSVVDMTPRLEIKGCSMKKFQTFKTISLVILAPIIVHFVFIFTKMRSIATLRIAEVATIVLPSQA
ncbi:hypothetical protein AGABI2DRAFT_121616 [Agaricus bisporus var. bisporus H97]|uniref:hypothetical protein n=1 Tax=Agaricus bisporus var. bisporus (strain H97 / ATCC MYA-4626 / FGSC 10389) TaxID=936046 RepID=UPI00029F60FB|nr:hypothetical protein AGABI2DRAFT_121616 [Agaricus bisporus var. bisporus H97]EKV43489.1 hypothetical protein AGABI2DRAFT_121616 [Agaricus bisporus var. bisporus H97]